MRRALTLATIPLLAALTLPSPAAAFDRPPGDDDVPDASASPGGPPCLEPVPTFDYNEDVLAYGVEVDLAGCDWWDGTEIELSATIERFDGVDDEGVNVATLCGGMIISYPEDGTPAETPVADSCGVTVEMEHPPVEVARYRPRTSRGPARFPIG
jgi:hypothetical protein